MMDKLTQKWHGVPIWILVSAGILVTYFGYTYFKNRNANAAATTGAGAVQSNLLQPPQSGGGAGSLTIPTTQVGEATQTPPFTSPAPDSGNSTPASVPQLDSAPITDPSVAPTVAPESDPISPQPLVGAIPIPTVESQVDPLAQTVSADRGAQLGKAGVTTKYTPPPVVHPVTIE